MARRHVTSGPGIPHTGAAYSPAVVVGETCFVSGQLPLDPETGSIVDGPFAREVTQALDNLQAVLAAAGFALEELVSTTVILADIDLWQELDDTWARYFDGIPGLPTRMVFEAGAVPLGARVEIQATAIRG